MKYLLLPEIFPRPLGHHCPPKGVAEAEMPLTPPGRSPEEEGLWDSPSARVGEGGSGHVCPFGSANNTGARPQLSRDKELRLSALSVFEL